MAQALNELYTTDVCAESVEIDGRLIPGSLTFANSEIDLVAAGWDQGIVAVFSTLKMYFPTGKWPRSMKSIVKYSVNGEPATLQVGSLQGDRDSRAQLLVGLKTFNAAK